VPFPPKPAPKAKAHHRGFIAKPPNAAEIDSFWLSVEINGIIVAAKGILSTKALAIADKVPAPPSAIRDPVLTAKAYHWQFLHFFATIEIVSMKKEEKKED
jgi:hypothetical protein